MDALTAIMTRRSIRRFTGEMIPKETLTTIVKAGMYAPSAHNYQPRHFILVTEREKLDAIPTFHPYAAMCPRAGGGILVCGDRARQPKEGYLALDCAATMENILLATHALGFGGVWLAVYPRTERMEKMAHLFHLPETIIPIAFAALGVPDEQVEQPDRFNPDALHRNEW